MGLHAVVEGSGRRIVLVHGFAQTQACWGDVAPALAVRDFIDMPVALVTSEDGDVGEADRPLFRVDAPHDQQLQRFRLGRYAGAVSKRHANDEALLLERTRQLAEHFDLSEPFSRIRGAIDEARRGMKA